jgi:hypothetical protein
MLSSRIAILIALTMVASSCASRKTPIEKTPVAPVASERRFDWAGTYDLVGQGFSEGERRATLYVERRDTTFAMNVEGPPGHLIASRIKGDSAEIVWSLPTDLMYVELHGAGDSLSGEWTIAYQTGKLVGVRRR